MGDNPKQKNIDENDSKNKVLEILINLQDEQTKKHVFYVSKYALLLGKKLKLSNKDLELIKISSLLHDVGKIAIPDYIINKNTSLTKDEYEFIKKHPVIGEVLLPNKGYEEIKKIIRSHHERIDGRGYPDGLKGDGIPYFAKIITIADSFDSMTTSRPYNKIKTVDEALFEIYKCSKPELDNTGKIIQQFDSYLADVFINVIKQEQMLIEEFKNNEDVINHHKKLTKLKF